MSAMRRLAFIAGLLLACEARAQAPAPNDDLLAALQGGDPAQVQAAVEGLGRAGPSIIPSMLPLLESPQAGIRAAAVQVLAAAGDESAVEPLSSALSSDPDRAVRVGAARALGRIKDPRAVNALIYGARADETELAVREAALAALGEQGNPEGVYFLVRTLRDDFNPTVCDAAAAALEKLTGETFGGDHRAWIAWIKDAHPEWLKTAPKSANQFPLGGMAAMVIIVFFGLSMYMAVHKWKAKP